MIKFNQATRTGRINSVIATYLYFLANIAGIVLVSINWGHAYFLAAWIWLPWLLVAFFLYTVVLWTDDFIRNGW